MSEKTFIKVFPTKTGRFRARVDYPVKGVHIHRRVEEITIGGQKWDKGYLKEYHEIILSKLRECLYGFIKEFFAQMDNPQRIFLDGNVPYSIIQDI